MLNINKPIFKMITELCQELNIEFESYSYGLLNSLKKDGKIRYMVLYKFDLNTVTSTEIAKDKYATYEVLKSNNIPIISHSIIFNPKTREGFASDIDLDIAKGLFDKYKQKMVIKANGSSQGKEVYLIENKEEIEKTIKDIFSRDNDSLSICPFEEIKNEYRVVVLDNECLFSYKKERPSIIGDGVKTIEDFMIDMQISKCDEKLDINYIPAPGEEVILNWKFNLSGGAIPKSIDNENTKKAIEQIASQAVKAINIRFCTVDIVENIKGEFKIMEVNGTVCMNKFSEKYPNGYEIAKDIYRKALIKMFE